jgi:hypothetical protein
VQQTLVNEIGGKVTERGKVIHPVFHLTASLVLLHSTRAGFGGLAYMRVLLLVFCSPRAIPGVLGRMRRR